MKLNAKQQELYEAVEAHMGQMWIEVISETNFEAGTKTKVTGRGLETTLSSMVESVGRFTHTPGGYRREVVLKILVTERHDSYDHVAHTQTIKERYLVTFA